MPWDQASPRWFHVTGYAKPVARVAVSKLPALDSGTTDAGTARDIPHRQALGGKKHNFSPLNMLERAIEIADDEALVLAILETDNYVDGLSHTTRLAYRPASVNPMSASVH
jgi:hypothetical protein